MHVSNAALAAVGLGLWQLGRLDHGTLGTALRGELGTFGIGLAALGVLLYSLLFAARHWRKLATWIVVPLLTVGYGLGLAEQLWDSSAWPANTAIAAAVPTVAISTYPASTRQHFMNSCITSGGTQSSCVCALDGIQAHYSLQDFVAFDARAKAGEKMPDDLVRIVSTCNASATH